MSIDNESAEAGFSSAMQERLLARFKNAPAQVEARVREERRADRSDAEKGRRRKGPPLVQLNLRVTQETFDLAHDLAAHLGGKLPGTIAKALAALAVATPGFKPRTKVGEG